MSGACDRPAAQVMLSLRWETRHHWRALCSEFGGDETTPAFILAIVVLALRRRFGLSPLEACRAFAEVHHDNARSG